MCDNSYKTVNELCITEIFTEVTTISYQCSKIRVHQTIIVRYNNKEMGCYYYGNGKTFMDKEKDKKKPK